MMVESNQRATGFRKNATQFFRLEKPDISKFSLDNLIRHMRDTSDLTEFIAKANQPEYLYWDKIKYKAGPSGMSPEDYWALIKFFRENTPDRARTPIKSESGKWFSWQQLPNLPQFLHDVDMQLGGRLVSRMAPDPKERQRFIARGIIEEAIASSQLEGANTTRKVAKRMLLEKRAPRDKSEQMILNNYAAMVAIEEQYRNTRLDLSVLLALHEHLTKGTIGLSDVGRLRKDTDDIVVSNPVDGIVYHVPPRERFLNEELPGLFAYANDDSKENRFTHPVLKAILLHFWVGYLHPFTDGNGRLARALFYWYLLQKGYWAFAYLPLSRVIKKSATQYRDAYVYSEQDDCDLTYFIDYNVRKIIQAKKEFEGYAERKQQENQEMASVAKTQFQLNDRQIQLLRFLYKNPGTSTTIRTHSTVYGIGRITARKDLTDLREKGFLLSKRIGRETPYLATSMIDRLFSR